ncbi:MAG: tyrosine-type recombinase/integrase [Terrimicrobiaceae bacterium]
MPKKLKSAEEHIFKRGDTYWIYFRSGGQRIRESLGVKTKREALAKVFRYRIGGIRSEFGTPLKALAKVYVAEETASGNFTPSTARGTAGAISRVSKLLKTTTANGVSPESPQAVYALFQDLSEATARTYAMRWHAFLKWLADRGHTTTFPTPVEYSKKRMVARRTNTVAMDAARKLIDYTDRPAVKFILYCGFFAGMRRNEIVMARPGWFDLAGGVIRIPEAEVTTIKGGKVYTWRTKNRLARSIPIHREFKAFLESFLAQDAAFCLAPEADGDIYRYDIRKPFEGTIADFRKDNPGILPPVCSMHTARHSWISALANSGKYSSTQISMWSGDQVRTIESNYMHPAVRGNELDSI